MFNVKRCRHVPGKARFPGFISHRINDHRPKDHRLRRQASRLATVLPALVLFAVLPATTAFAQDPVEFKGHKEVVYDAKFLPDGKSLVTASFDQTLKLWDIESQKMLRTMEGHTGIVLTVDVSPDGRVIASGSSDRTIRLWDVPKSDPVLTSKVHDSPATAMATSKDGTLIATADDKGLVRIWTAAVAVAGDDAAPAALENPRAKSTSGRRFRASPGGTTNCSWRSRVPTERFELSIPQMASSLGQWVLTMVQFPDSSSARTISRSTRAVPTVCAAMAHDHSGSPYI